MYPLQLRLTATTMMTMMTTTITPAIDTPSDARPSLLAPAGSDTASLVAATAHKFDYMLHTRTVKLNILFLPPCTDELMFYI